MSEAQAPQGHRRGHEQADVTASNITWIALALYAVIALVGITLWLLLGDLYRRYPPSLTPQRPPVIRNLPPLETDPAAELRALRAREQAQLEHYGWIDPKQGIVRLPIDRAMVLYAQRAREPGAKP